MSQAIDLFDKYEESFDRPLDSTPFVREHKGALSLHFNLFEVQSEMYEHAPDELVLSYTRAMMNFLCFNKQPSHVGMIGLGGGSMPKYCYRRLPHTKISVAEINPEVIALRDCFFIPPDDHRFHTYCEDGADFVQRHQAQFDVLLVDGFDHKGQPAQLCSQQFYNDCYRSLTPHGLLVVNACEGGSMLISRIRRSFQTEVLVAGCGDDSANSIVFAGKGSTLTATHLLPKSEWSKIRVTGMRSIRTA